MKILIEQYGYDKDRLSIILDPHYFTEMRDGKAKIPYVGYFLSRKIPDTVFILPKVFIIYGKAFGEYELEEIIDFDNLKQEHKANVFSLSVWIYRAIKLYFQRKDKASDEAEIMQNVVSHQGPSNETMIDIVLSLLKFDKEHKSLFTYITRLKHSGQNKIHWQKTISKTKALIQNGVPVYLNPHTKQKDINFDEELIVLFYSVLNYLAQEFKFNVRPAFGYELLKPENIQSMIESGKGVRVLRQNRRKYFTDEMVQLWNLLFTFFEQSQYVQSKDNQDEQAMLVREFNLVFEDMIDSLIGDNNLDHRLKKHKDGKIIDHIYRDNSLIEDKKQIYFIGDSKYYKDDNDIGPDSIYKQFTYAKNVIQYNIDFFNQDPEAFERTNLQYRDNTTEGYNITPNFFIRGHLQAEQLNNYSNANLQLEKMIDGKSHRISYHFENRLFDRDTLILQTYNINFLFVLACYVLGAGERTQEIRKIFRENIKKVLQEQYDFYAMTPREEINAEEFIKDNFQQLLGKVYTPYDIPDTQQYFALALDKDKKYNDENEYILNLVDTGFYCKQCSLGQDPRTVLPTVVQPERAIQPVSLLTTHHIQRYPTQHFLIGCYHSKEQLDWIMGKNDKGTNLYNVRLKKRGSDVRDGALSPTYLASLDVKFVILYEYNAENKGYRVFHVHHHATLDEERMKKALYPNPQGNYLCYVFDEEVQLSTRISLHDIITDAKLLPDYIDGTPIFETGDELMKYIV
ncbi:MAG: LlaJI family restriction endonuclease [Bacteroidales bacterium]|nr:LlaJI family restriction endonuclease [Bacteroidales bacterium]